MTDRGVAGGRRGSQGTMAKTPAFPGRGSQGSQASQKETAREDPPDPATLVVQTRRSSADALAARLRAARRHAQMASPHTPEGAARRAAVARLEAELECPKAPTSTRGPKGAQPGDIVRAERSSWEVLEIDPDRREAICRLLGGSHAVRRFRARRIEQVVRAPREPLRR